MRSPLRTLLSVLSPLLVLAAAAGWLLGDASRPLTPEAAANDAALAKPGEPVGMLIVGNSKSNTDVDPLALGKALAYERPIVNVRVAGSSAPAWYAVLEQRVFAADHRPEVVIVYGQLSAMLRAEATALAERIRVENQLTTASPVLDAKVLGNSSGLSATARRRATAAHDSLLTNVRDLAVGALLAPPGTAGVGAAGKATAEPALERMFGSNARFLKGGGARVMPVAEAEANWAMTASDGPPSASLIPDLVEIVRAHDAKIIFVRAPLPPSSQYRDSLPLEVEAATLDLLNELGVSYVDLHAIDLPGGSFLDDYHLSRGGRATVTAALAAAILEADILNGGVARAHPALIATSVTRVGAPPPTPPLTYVPGTDRPCVLRAKLPGLAFLANDTLAAAGLGRATPLVLSDAVGPLDSRAPGKGFGETCAAGWRQRPSGLEVSPRAAPSPDGLSLTLAADLAVPDEKGAPVWWVYPDTAIEWRYDSAWTNGSVRVSVTARAVQGASARLRVGETEVPLLPDGRLLRATVEVPPSELAAAWSVSVLAGADTWLVLDELLLGTQRVIGEPAATVNPLARRGAPAAPPRPLPTGTPGTDGALTTIPVPGYAHIADDALRARTGYACSPLQLGAAGALDGWMIDDGHKLKKVLESGKRGFLHTGNELLIAAASAPSTTPPTATAGASASQGMPTGPYEVRLDPVRRCAKGTWLYPGDELVWPIPTALGSRLRLGADTLLLNGIALVPEQDGRESVALQARVRVTDVGRERTIEGEVVLPATGGFTDACLRLDEPLPPQARIELTLSAPDPSAWFIVWAANIGESEHLSGCAR
ncbi:MAG: hypothetical protein Q8P18_24055 [Pseudomonadota bacterium]|nr:hypothetical protein [Pseudomonadota bacterium]